MLVGGPALGGGGKTPVVQLLARRAAEGGARVCVVAHGYGGRARGLVERPDPEAYGDEAAALRRALPASVRIHIGDRRAAGDHDADLILIDGGLHDLRCPRRQTIAVIDATASRRLLPAGPNRLDPNRLSADLRWLHRIDEPGSTGRGMVESVVRVTGVEVGQALHPPDWLLGREVTAVAGIARPASFVHALERCGARVVARLLRADHHRFDPAELAGLPTPITTTKNAPWLPGACAVLHTELELRRGAELVEALLP